MPYSSGRFVRLFNWVRDQADGILITASRMDADMDDVATGLSTGICKDGQSTITANIPMGGRLITGVGAPAADGDILTREVGDARFTSKLPPGGRLTLRTGTPVMTSNVTATTLRYTPFIHNIIQHYNGTIMSGTTFSELSISPSLAASTNYDVFSYLSGGSPALAVAAWTNDTTRAISLTRTQGIWLNTTAVTAGPSALRGTYLGTVRTDANSVLRWTLETDNETSPGGFAGVWNAFNRVEFVATILVNSDNWEPEEEWNEFGFDGTYSGVTLVVGLAEDAIRARVSAGLDAGIGTDIYTGIGVARPTDDEATINVPDGVVARGSSDNETRPGQSYTSFYSGVPGIGAHLVRGLEYGNDVGGDLSQRAQIYGLNSVASDIGYLAAVTVEFRA